ncbi:MAG TPA: oligoendopeptidase F [Candidatus Polarisedimenticolaceae bacterium]|nr:oligoendopeptidase F [Candidatus Polarisedimenticolaceae bacterium]
MTRRMLGLSLVLALTAPVAFAADEAGRPVDPKYTWNLTDLYPNQEAWAAAKNATVADLPKIEMCKGHLGDSAKALADCLDLISDVGKRLSKVGVYASMSFDLDTRVSSMQQMNDQARLAGTAFAAATSWVNPELQAVGADKIRGFVASESRLAVYKQPLEDVLRRAAHTLDPESERILAESRIVQGTGQSIRDVFVNADFPYPTVTLSTGEKVRLDAQGYTKYRAVANRADRLAVFQAFWSTYGDYTRTLGTALGAGVQAHEFSRKMHKYDSSLEEALFNDNVPTAVYNELIKDLHANLGTLHRYLKLRQRMMGLDKLGYEDLYAPIVGKVDRRFTPEEAMAATLDAVAMLGPDYQNALRQGFASRWIDWFPRPGKRSGAYSTGTYGTHPFQLQNFTGLYDEVSTLAHESGHSMHTYLADKAQPYATHDYPIFIAEVASTLNENLLVHSMIAKAKTDDERLSLLGSYLDSLRTTLFRQGLLAEFELRVHEMVAKGEPLTGDNVSELYLKLLREYYGHDQGVCEVKDTYKAEWAYIPHMYYDFYVYQYATSMIASAKLADGIRAEAAAKPASTAKRDAYLGMLSSGSSKYAYDMLKDAGVDMATPEPFAAAMREMNKTIDAMEEILNKKGTAGKK